REGLSDLAAVPHEVSPRLRVHEGGQVDREGVELLARLRGLLLARQFLLVVSSWLFLSGSYFVCTWCRGPLHVVQRYPCMWCRGCCTWCRGRRADPCTWCK